MGRVKLPIPISGGLILSYQCTAECRYCMYACSPRWKHWISEEVLEEILRQLAGKIAPSPYGPDSVSLNYGLHFTGGEPFLNFELLLKAVETAERLKIPSTFVETNCYWALDDKTVREKLKLLKEVGLKGILISVNPYYLEYVPFERTERAIRISREIFGRNVMVYQLNYYLIFKKLGVKGRLKLEDYLEMSKGENLVRNAEILLMGRAVYKLKDFYPRHPADHFLDQLCWPPFLREWHNHFDCYGNFLPGYCSGISLGDCRKLDEILRDGLNLDEKPILKFLVNQDFRGLLQFAKKLGFKESEEGYVSKCHLCLDIRRFLIDHGEFEELKPREFYFHLF
ncbi:MAG: 4Fe-4S cluster-binding domain-containing protein [Candidatus Bathyarchaeia archaeon]